jgi:hypothetical protein
MGTRSHFVSSKPVRISLPDDPEQWVDIKATLSVGDRNALYTSMAHIEDGKSEIQVGRYLSALLETAIVDWHLLDEDGKAVPFDPALIASFDPDDPLIELVQDEVAKRNPFGKKKTSGV